MNNKFYKIAKILIAVLGLIGIIMLVRVLGTDEEMLKTDLDIQSGIVDPFVSFTIFMLIITAAFAVIFSVINLVKNPAALKKAVISLAVLGILFAIAYGAASDAEITGANGAYLEGGEQGSTPKMIGALIKYTYILGAAGLAMVIWGSVKAMFSNN
ncbi:hypothetical protein KH5_14580 [Urechidicola sp. KH5]